MATIQVKPSMFSGASSPFFKQAWTTTPADFDILAEGPSGDTAQQWGYACRRITVQTAGTLVLTLADGTTTVTLTCANGEVLDIEAINIAATSTAQGVKVFW